MRIFTQFAAIFDTRVSTVSTGISQLTKYISIIAKERDSFNRAMLPDRRSNAIEWKYVIRARVCVYGARRPLAERADLDNVYYTLSRGTQLLFAA